MKPVVFFLLCLSAGCDLSGPTVEAIATSPDQKSLVKQQGAATPPHDTLKASPKSSLPLVSLHDIASCQSVLSANAIEGAFPDVTYKKEQVTMVTSPHTFLKTPLVTCIYSHPNSFMIVEVSQPLNLRMMANHEQKPDPSSVLQRSKWEPHAFNTERYDTPFVITGNIWSLLVSIRSRDFDIRIRFAPNHAPSKAQFFTIAQGIIHEIGQLNQNH